MKFEAPQFESEESQVLGFEKAQEEERKTLLGKFGKVKPGRVKTLLGALLLMTSVGCGEKLDSDTQKEPNKKPDAEQTENHGRSARSQERHREAKERLRDHKVIRLEIESILGKPCKNIEYTNINGKTSITVDGKQINLTTEQVKKIEGTLLSARQQGEEKERGELKEITPDQNNRVIRGQDYEEDWDK